MNKIIKQGLQISAGLDPSSQKEMRSVLRSIFTDETHIDLNTPENIKAIQVFASLFRDVFAQVGNKDFDFSKIIKLPGSEIFDSLKSSIAEFESAWDSITAKFGDDGLKNIFMRNQSELDDALRRMTNRQGNINKGAVKSIKDVWKPIKSKDINYLLEEARGLKSDFILSDTWENQTKAALKYLNVYQRIKELTDLDIDNARKRGMREVEFGDTFKNLGNLGAYTVQQMESVKTQMQTSLQNIFNLALGKPLIGLTEGGALDINVVPKVIDAIDVGDIIGGKKSIEIPVDPIFKSNLDELRRLYVESATDDNAFKKFEKLQYEMVKALPVDVQEQAMDRLLQFAEMDRVIGKSYGAIWKDFIGYGLPVGIGTGAGTGLGNGSGDGVGIAPEEIKNANELSEVLQRVESAYRELDALSDDPWNMKNEEDVNRILQERLAIIQRIGSENLKAYNPEWYSNVEYMNNEYASRLDSFAESKDDEIYNQLDENFGYDNGIVASSQELETLLAKRRELMQGIHFDAEQEYLEQEKINQSIERRIALMRQLEPLVTNGSITQDDLENMLYEQGELDERRSMLSGIQQDLLDADDINEAQYMLDEYEKILVKTASGKKLTLGPEMSEADWKSFMNMDTEKAKSIEFIRKETMAHQENTSAINSEAQAHEKLNTVERQNFQNSEKINSKYENNDNVEQSIITEEEVRQAEENYERLRSKLISLQNEGSEALAELEKLGERAKVYGFGSDKTALQEGKIQTTLAKNNRGKYVVDMLKNGYEAIQTSSGEYGFNRPDLGNGVFTKITKTEYEYAQYLSQKIKELNVGWDEGLKILKSQNGQLEAARERVNSINSEYEKTNLEAERAYEVQANAHNQWNRQKNEKIKEQSIVDDTPKLQDENTKLDEQNDKLKENINQENAELEQQKKIINDVVAAKQGLKASQTKLGVTDGKDLFGKSTLDTVKEKQKILATYLQELTQIEAQEKKNGALTEEEVARRKELVGLIRNMELAVRYKDGSFYDTRNLDGMGSELSEQIEQLNQVLNLRKQITLGYYNTGTYGTVADTFSGESVSNLINLGSIEGITEFDSSIVGQLAREYQFLHEQMLRCMLVGEEVPQSTLDRLKWFEAVDVSQIENMIPRVAELQQQINAIQNSGEYSDIRSAKIGQDDAYYDEKIQQIQTLIALQTEYMSIGGPWQANTIGSFSIDHSNESLQSTIEFFETLKKGARDVVRLKAELKNMFPDIDVSADRYKDMFDHLAMGTDSYDYTLSKITKSYNAIPREKLESDVSASIEALKKLDTFKWDTSTDDAYREVLKGIRDGTYTTVDQSIAKFKELAGIIETVKTGSTVGVSNRGSNIGLGTGTIDAGTESGESSGIVIKEVGNLDKIRAKVAEVTAAVNTKSKEFYNEGQIVSQVVGKENAALISLKGNIEAITNAVNTKAQAFIKEEGIVRQSIGRENSALIHLQTNMNNATSGLGGALSNLRGVRMPNLSNTRSQANIENETLALGDLQTRINEVISAVRTKTAAFVQEETVVRQSVGREISALIQLMQNINNVNMGITTLTQGLNTALNNIAASNGINLNINTTVNLATVENILSNILTAIPNAGSGVQNNNGNSGNGSQGGGDLAGRIAVQNATLDNFEAKLLNIGQLTPAVQNQINQLRTSLNNVTDNQGLTVWMNQFKTMRTNMNTEGIISDLNTLEQMYERLGQLRAKFTQANSSEEKNSWDLLIQQMETAIQLMQQGLNIDQNWFDNKALEAYTRSMEKYNDQMIKAKTKENQKSVASTFNEEIKNAQREAGINKSKSTESRAIDTLISARQIQGITPEQTANLDVYEGKIEALRNTINSFPKDGIATEAQKNQLIAQRLEVDAYTKEIQELVANYEKLSGANVEEIGKNTLGKDASVMDQQKQLSDMVIQYTNGKAVIKSYDAATNELKYTMKGASGEVTTYTATLRGLDNTLVTVRGQTTRTIGVIDSVVKKVKEFSYYFTGSMMIYRVIGWIRDGVTAVKEIDSALIELKKVTDETSDTYNRFLDTASAKAEKLGSTIVDVTSATAEFARIGYDIEVASDLAEAAIVYKNVGDGIESASDAAKSIISTIKGFRLEASDAMSIVDKFNEVGNNFAIDSKGVGDALMRSASALSAAGNDVNESIGLITAANEVVQDPETVGTALKTLTMRLRAAKTEMEDEGLETEGMAESTAKLRAQLKALSHDKVDIMIDNDTFKNTTEILREMSLAWEDMTDIERASALELMGGKFCLYV